MDERSGLRELIREWGAKKQEAEEGQRTALAEAQRWQQLQSEALEALAHFTFALEALEHASGNGEAANPSASEEPERQSEAPPTPTRTRKSERPKRSRRKRARKPTSVQLIPELVGNDFISIGEMKRRLDQQGKPVAKQTLEYGVKKLIAAGVLDRRQAPAESSADWIYGLKAGVASEG